MLMPSTYFQKSFMNEFLDKLINQQKHKKEG